MPAIVAAGARKEKLRQRTWKPPASRREPRPYAELRAASAFSFLDGASLPEDLVEESCRRGLPAVALVDTNGVYGAPRFYKAAREAGLKALVGAEITLASVPTSPRPSGKGGSASPRLSLLVENRAGYRNLCRLITAGALGKEKGATAVTWEQIAAQASLASARSFPDGSTSRSRAIACAPRSTGIVRPSRSRRRWRFLSSRPTACATRGLATRSSTTC